MVPSFPGSTYWRARAYRSRSRGKSHLAIRSHSRGQYRSISTTKNRRSRSCSPSFSRSSSGSFSSHGSRPRHGHSRRSGSSHSRRSRHDHRPHRGHRSLSKMTSWRSHHRSSHGRKHITRSPLVSSGFSHPSLEPKRRLSFQTESNHLPLVSTNTASGFSGFSAVYATASHSSTRDNVVHGVQPDMRNLIRQILTEELRSTTVSIPFFIGKS